MSWIRSGTERKMSSTKVSGAAHHGPTAAEHAEDDAEQRAADTEMAVTSSVNPAPGEEPGR